MARINSESIDFTGLTIKCDALETNGVEFDAGDMADVAGFVGTLTASAAELNILDGATLDVNELNILDGVTATAAELNYNDIAVLGTGAASKAVVLDGGDDYTWPATGVLTYGVLKDPAGTSLGATVAELNATDISAQTETLTADGAISVLKTFTKLEDTGTGAYTLAAPDASMVGRLKVIEMTVDNGAVTLALTNVTGHTAETATFDDVGDNLVLIGGAATKWIYVAATATLA